MTKNLWSILAEFTHPYSSESFEQASNTMKTAIEHLCLPEIFIQRLNISLTETITKRAGGTDEDQATSTVKIRILSNYTDSRTQTSRSIWGFFFIEKKQVIELYLYQDQA